MDLGAALIAGFVATVVLTALMYTGPVLGFPKMDMIGMLGTMLTANQSIAYVLGTIMHFVMGSILAVIYAVLWSLDVGRPTWVWGLVFGAIHSFVSLAMLPIMLRLHPRPPAMPRDTPMKIGMIMGHLVYGLIVAMVYGALAGP